MLVQTALVLLIVGILVYTFRGQAGPIFEQLAQTSPAMVVLICMGGLLYNLLEGWVLCSMARRSKPDFKLREGVFCSLYSAFYRVASMGSASGIASIIYLNSRGVEYSKASGFYTIHYMLHKLSTVLCALLFLVLNLGFMRANYGGYFHLLWAGCLLVFVICAGIAIVCCWEKLHGWAITLIEKIDRKQRHCAEIQMLNEFFGTMEHAAADILTDKKLVAGILLRSMLKSLCWYSIPYVLLGGKVTLMQAVGVTAVSVVLASVLPAPAGIGSTEVVYAAMFSVLVGTAQAGASALLYRFATFVVPFAVGGIAAGVRHFCGRTAPERDKQ